MSGAGAACKPSQARVFVPGGLRDAQVTVSTGAMNFQRRRSAGAPPRAGGGASGGAGGGASGGAGGGVRAMKQRLEQQSQQTKQTKQSQQSQPNQESGPLRTTLHPKLAIKPAEQHADQSADEPVDKARLKMDSKATNCPRCASRAR